MNPTRLHIATLLFPLLVAACESEVEVPGAEGVGGGETIDADEDTAEGTGGTTSTTSTTSTTGGAGGAAGTGGTGAGGGHVVGRLPGGLQELTGSGGGASGTGGSTSSGGDPDPADTCPGETHSLTLDGTEVTLDGTTVGAADDLDTCHSEPATDGGDRVYAFQLSAPGNLHLALTHGAELDAALVVRAGCDSLTGEYCHDIDTLAEAHIMYRTEETIFVIVDAQGATAGAFQLTATLESNDCGDGIQGGDEECDVGAGVADDGCVDPGELGECTAETPDVGSDLCAGEPLAIPSGLSSVLASAGLSTNGYVDDYESSCQYEPGGVDRVFVLTPAVTGTLTVTSGTDATNSESMCAIDQNGPGCWDQMLHVRSSCEDIGTEVACSDVVDVEEVTFPVVAAVPMYLFVDGYDQGAYSRGPFNLHFDLQPE